MVVPDLWQQQAVAALRAGKDVVVHAPTGAGKTLIFELWSNQGKPHRQAIYTVPTRALANDKLAEWRARGWSVGIATGDLSDNLDAPVIVATLETQKNRLIRGDGPSLLVIDEYQLLGDADRGLNYELSIALAPERTQLLLLSGSVANPHHVVFWLKRLGRDAVLVRHEERPVPLEEVHGQELNFHVPSEIRSYWARFCAKALGGDLGPVLLFAPRRAMTEDLAADIARQLPLPAVPLVLTPEQKALVGDNLARMLARRVAYHHSGLSYAARAGVIEPLAKAGVLRVVVATMGLAAGINFSLRSVAMAADSYRRDNVEIPIRPDEILQMAGRAGRRGIDDTGYFLISANELRLRDGHAAHLARCGIVDWNALLGLMHAAAEAGRDPFTEAARVQQRLFSTKPVILGIEESLKNPDTPCGLKTDSERSRHVKKMVREFLNSRGEWERWTQFRDLPASEVKMFEPMSEAALNLYKLENKSARAQSAAGHAPRSAGLQTGANHANSDEAETRRSGDPRSEVEAGPAVTHATLRAPKLLPVLTVPVAVDKLGQGTLMKLSDGSYGRATAVADILNGKRVLLAKWVRKLTNWNGRETSLKAWRELALPILERRLAEQKTPVVGYEYPEPITAPDAGSAAPGESQTSVGLAGDSMAGEEVEAGESGISGTRSSGNDVGVGTVRVLVSIAQLPLRACVDAHGVALWRPPEREIMPPDCTRCALVPVCRQLPTAPGVASVWRRLGLIDARGVPTRRGRIVSFFQQGDGLAIAAALEDEKFPLDEFIYELANLHAGFRFAGQDARWGGRIAMACQKTYGLQTMTGYLQDGLPPEYGAGADEVVRDVHRDPSSKSAWVTEFRGAGDIDRAIIEWRSMLRQVSNSPPLDWARWTALQKMAKAILAETESPTLMELPPLSYLQKKRVEHRLSFRRH